MRGGTLSGADTYSEGHAVDFDFAQPTLAGQRPKFSVLKPIPLVSDAITHGSKALLEAGFGQ